MSLTGSEGQLALAFVSSHLQIDVHLKAKQDRQQNHQPEGNYCDN